MVFVLNPMHCTILAYRAVSEHQWFLGCEEHRIVSREEAIYHWEIHNNSNGLTSAQEFALHYKIHLQEIENFMTLHEKIGDLDEVLTNEQVHALLKD